MLLRTTMLPSRLRKRISRRFMNFLSIGRGTNKTLSSKLPVQKPFRFLRWFLFSGSENRRFGALIGFPLRIPHQKFEIYEKVLLEDRYPEWGNTKSEFPNAQQLCLKDPKSIAVFRRFDCRTTSWLYLKPQ